MPEIRHISQAPTGRRPLARGSGIDAHRHDTHQIVYACRGVVSVTTDAGVWVAPANRAIWIPAGTVHEHRAHGDTDLRLVGLTDNPLGLNRPAVLAVAPLLRELITAYTAAPEPPARDCEPPTPGTHEPTTPAHPASSTEPADGTHLDGRHTAAGIPPERDAAGGGTADAHAFGVGAAEDGAAGHETTALGEAEHSTTARGAAGSGVVGGDERGRLLAVLLDQLKRAPEQQLHLPTPEDPRLTAVCTALHEDPADNRTLAQLARQAGTSDRTLARLCRRELGMSFPQWRTQLRLHHALLLLADGEPVTAVAHRCGWASASAFIDVFRRAFGYTPGRAFTL
ncbi:helix-turn-helix transcriptional regulator [Nonomuraea sp. B12E4]|uniref:helix-turn-helix transcriptional regulator n=1 Tax=Nonomuraea sp. B12E4 TaxID=3153564 RepID=UPI00325C87FE